MNRPLTTIHAAIMAAMLATGCYTLLATQNQVAAQTKGPSLPNPFRAATVNTASPGLPSPGQTGGAAPLTPQARQLSDQALRDARRALAVGDRARAQQMLSKAEQLKVAYDGKGDSPASVAESLSELTQLNALKASAGNRPAWRESYAKFLLVQADALYGWNDIKGAERAANEALQIGGANVGEASSSANRAQELLQKIVQAKLAATTSSATGSDLAGNVEPASSEQPLLLARRSDAASERLAQAPQPLPAVGEEEISAMPDDAAGLIAAGEAALRQGDRAKALQHFRAAHEKQSDLDLLSQQRLQGHLQMLSAADAKPENAGAGDEPKTASSDRSGLIDAADAGQKVLVKQIWSDVSKRQAEAERLREQDPQKSLDALLDARSLVEKSALEDRMKQQLYSRIALSESKTQQYIDEHKAEIDLARQNKAVTDENERQQSVKLAVQQRIAALVEEYNKLIDENRIAEAELVANRLYEMAPDDLVAQQVHLQAKTIRRLKLEQEIVDATEEGVASTLLDTRRIAGEAINDGNVPITFDKRFGDLKRKSSGDVNPRLSPEELKIEQKLKTPVLPQYNETPLSQVVDGLSKLVGINIHLDPEGLRAEGVQSDAPVTLNLPQPISLKSALNLILGPHHLTYTIRDDVLKITSETISDGEVYPRVYNVADLVITIPNFVPSNNMGLQGLINDAYAAMGYGGGAGAGPIALAANHRLGQPKTGVNDDAVLAQQVGANPGSGAAASFPAANGPGGAGGAANADFDSLIDLIINTVDSESWTENGTGKGEIQPFPTNLSLVISQTQKIHEQIADLLEQLRRLQDLQVTIEVRFIRLSDSFFEQIGVDFDFNIEDGTGISTLGGVTNGLTVGSTFEPRRSSATVGLDAGGGGGDFPNFSLDLDIPFRQESATLAQPTVGQAVPIGTFGMAVLSDIEAYFLVNASQGNRRANVLNAPKVTLFNGQQGIVVDSAFRPFVISVIPVVGEFAAAQQPVIVVLSEGTMLTVQAVVSDDRRYVRLTLVPFFSQIGEVREFTFEGSQSSTTNSDVTDADEDGKNEANQNAQTVTRSGTTVQLPTFEVISVSTTVSVPDGGTVLLGGIKRLREGRNEFGVPLLSKIPYIDRLFRNTGIGRETDSLMMMVTPHIIIQEEEEERLGIDTDVE